MRKLAVFNNVSLDGYFTDAHGDMSWAHKSDPEWNAFIADNAGGEAEFMLGRVTYEMMASYWPTPEAAKQMPETAAAMNARTKVVFSKKLDSASWQKEVPWPNSRLVQGDLVAEVRKLKEASGPMLLLMGSGTIVAQLTAAGLIDAYQVVVVPLVLGSGRTMFDGVKERVALSLDRSRAFKNGNVVLWYSAGKPKA